MGPGCPKQVSPHYQGHRRGGHSELFSDCSYVGKASRLNNLEENWKKLKGLIIQTRPNICIGKFFLSPFQETEHFQFEFRIPEKD